MRTISLKSLFVALLIPVAAGIGCSKVATEQPPAEKTAVDDAAVVESTAVDDHGGWWCVEHGVPESECGICDAKLAAEFQRNGDWCKQHDRPDSQCFVCHPELAAAFAARYEAKYGEPPPKPEG